MQKSRYICPICGSRELTIKYEATYVYSYVVDSDAPGLKNTNEFLPFLYDKREQKEARQYIECNNCNTQYPYIYADGKNNIDFMVLEKALTPENAMKSRYEE